MSNLQKPPYGELPDNENLIRNGLVLDLPMLGVGDLNDYSLNGNNGTNNSAEWVAGEVGPALSFDGSSSGISLPQSVNDTITSSQELTFSAYVRVTNTGADGALFSIFNSTGVQQTLLFWMDAGGSNPSWTFLTASSGGIYQLTSVNVDNVKINEWQYVTGVVSLTHIRVYIDGQLSAEQALTTIPPMRISSQTPYIGRSGEGRYLQGDIAFATLYNRGFTSQEVKAQYEDPWQAWQKDNITLWAAAQGGVPPTTGSVNLLDGLFARKRLIA